MAQVDYDFDFGAGIETHRMSKKGQYMHALVRMTLAEKFSTSFISAHV